MGMLPISGKVETQIAAEQFDRDRKTRANEQPIDDSAASRHPETLIQVALMSLAEQSCMDV